MNKPLTEGVFQVGIMVHDIDECLKLFCDTLGMQVVFEARNQIQHSKELSGTENQVMNVLMLHGEGGIDLEVHQYVDPPARPHPPMQHSDLGSMHFMLRVRDMEKTVRAVEDLGYKFIMPVIASAHIPGFKYTYFRGPEGIMIELHEGEVRMPKELKDSVR